MSSIPKKLNQLKESTLGNNSSTLTIRSNFSLKHSKHRYFPFNSEVSSLTMYNSPYKMNKTINLFARNYYILPSRKHEKIQKEISFITKNYLGHSENQNNYGRITKSLHHLKSNKLICSSKNISINSPTKKVLTTGVLNTLSNHYVRNNKGSKSLRQRKKLQLSSNENMITEKNRYYGRNDDSHENFMREMSEWKEKKMFEWKKL